MQRTLLLCFFSLSGIVLGAMIASLAAHTPGLSWLAFSQSIGFHPVLDLSIVKLDLNFTMGISVAPVLTVGLALFLSTLSPRRCDKEGEKPKSCSFLNESGRKIRSEYDTCLATPHSPAAAVCD